MNQPTTNAPAARAPQQTIIQMLSGDAMRKQFALALPRLVGVDRFIRTAMTAIRNEPKLAQCTQASLMGALMTAAQLGLEIGVGGQAYLLPFGDKATFVVGFKGFIDLAYRSGLVSGIQAGAVREGDHWVFRRGLNPECEHEEADQRGKLIAAYCIVHLKGGGYVFDRVNAGDIARIKQFSRSSGRPDSPWQTNEEAMWIKSAIRKVAKLMPQSPELRAALEADEHDDPAGVAAAFTGQTIDVPAETVPPADTAPTANPFAPKAGQ